MHFGLLHRDSPALEKSTILLADERRVFRVLEIEASDPAVTGRADEPEVTQAVHKIVLRLDPAQLGSAAIQSGKVRIETDASDCPHIEINWSVFLRDAASETDRGGGVVPQQQVERESS